MSATSSTPLLNPGLRVPILPSRLDHVPKTANESQSDHATYVSVPWSNLRGCMFDVPSISRFKITGQVNYKAGKLIKWGFEGRNTRVDCPEENKIEPANCPPPVEVCTEPPRSDSPVEACTRERTNCASTATRRLVLTKVSAGNTMGGPLGPNVLITGTPGTGKTCTSQQIAVGVVLWFICVVGNSSRQ